MDVKTLNNLDIKIVYETFKKAFSDYEIKKELSFEEFYEMLKTRSFNPFYSIGYFDNDKLVSFINMGYREEANKKLFYNISTGVIPKYRRKGLSDSLIKILINNLKEKNLDYFSLEVLENNKPAIELYKKNNFKISRVLKSFKIEKKLLKETKINFEYKKTPEIYLSIKNYMDYMTFKPSWQNDRSSIINNMENYNFIFLYDNNNLFAYGIIHKIYGGILQIGVLEEYKNKGIELELIFLLKECTESNTINFINIEKDDYLTYKLNEIGFVNYINQYEMLLEL
ncbi:MAG: GNAT family N-acetyltransferase [Candidatus Sericytochromatia bacterium]